MDKDIEYTIQLKSALIIPIEITISLDQLKEYPVIDLGSDPDYYDEEVLEEYK